MNADDAGSRMVLVDASAFITLAEINLVAHLLALDGELYVPHAVANEITTGPAKSALSSAKESGGIQTMDVTMKVREAAEYLGRDLSREDLEGSGHRQIEGDVALLAFALQNSEPSSPPVVIVTDDKPLRETCKTLSIPVSGSIGVLIRAVERGDLEPTTAKEKLYAMDEVGARLSASLVKRAERLIEDASKR